VSIVTSLMLSTLNFSILYPPLISLKIFYSRQREL
jgi:hypothetical protein